MTQAIKFVHASDLHLDRALTGISELPAHLKGTLANAPYQAAENIINLAIGERVDFVLLAGDLVDLDQGGPRATAFLQNQFERLAEKNIPVYWCGGLVDPPDRWPGAASLPANVVTFGSTAFERVVCQRDKKPMATIHGTGHVASRDGFRDLHIDSDEAFPIVLAYGEFDKTSFEPQAVRYWAMGGSHAARVSERATSSVVYPGTPQARSEDETGRTAVPWLRSTPPARLASSRSPLTRFAGCLKAFRLPSRPATTRSRISLPTAACNWWLTCRSNSVW